VSPRWRVLALMTAAQAGASVVQQALGSLSPILVTTFDLSKAQLGVVFTAMMLGCAGFTAAAGVMTDRWGERRMVFVSGATMTVALLAAPLFPSYGWLVAVMAVFGAGYAASTPAGGRAVLAWFDRDRGFAMGIRQTGVPLGGTFGALTLPAVAHAVGFRAAFVFAAVLVAVPTAIAYAGYREARDEAAPPQSTGMLLRGMRVLARDPRLIGVTLTCMVLVSAQTVMNAFITVSAVTVIGTSAAVAALAFALAQGMAAVGRLSWGWASDRIFNDRLVPLAIICVLAAIASAVLGLLGRGAVAPLFFAAALLGFSGAGWNGLMAAAMAEVGGTERAASALGLALSAIYGASAVAPAVFGTLADHASLRASWTLMAVLSLVAVVPVLRLRFALSKTAATTT
jgi:MFS transporter, ACS family, hexuronate transporter